MKKKSGIWYAASVIMYLRLKRGRQSSYSVYENVYLVFSGSPEGARRRAESLGRAEEIGEGLELNGKPAELVFGGVRKVVSCAADPAVPGGSIVTKLYDGVEATYSSFTVKGRSALKALVEGRAVSVVYGE